MPSHEYLHTHIHTYIHISHNNTKSDDDIWEENRDIFPPFIFLDENPTEEPTLIYFEEKQTKRSVLAPFLLRFSSPYHADRHTYPHRTIETPTRLHLYVTEQKGKYYPKRSSIIHTNADKHKSIPKTSIYTYVYVQHLDVFLDWLMFSSLEDHLAP